MHNFSTRRLASHSLAAILIVVAALALVASLSAQGHVATSASLVQLGVSEDPISWPSGDWAIFPYQIENSGSEAAEGYEVELIELAK